MEIQKDAVVVIEYTVQLDDGSFVKGETEPESMNFVVGYEKILPALEQRLMGQPQGAELEFVIPAEEAFGKPDPALVKTKPLELFPQGKDLQPGKWVVATNQKTGAQYGFFVKAKSADSIVLDYNHPLAGQDLHYRVKVVSVRPATREELEFLRPCEFKDEQ